MKNALWKVFIFIKKHWKVIRVVIPVVLITVTFILGILGLSSQNDAKSPDEQNIWNIIFSVLGMFFLAYDGSADSELSVILAKYLAAVFTSYVLILLAWKFIASAFVMAIRRWRKKSVLVVGENVFATALLDSLKYRGLGHKWKNFPGRGKIVLMGSEEENLQYLQKHSLLKEKSTGYESHIFVRTSKMNGKISTNGNIMFFSLEEIAARKYWENYPVVNKNDLKNAFYSTDEQDFNIAIIGEGELLEEVLLYATQMNIYGECFHIHYDIYGNNQRFEAIHNHCDELGFRFYHGEWWNNDTVKDILRKYDRIIILDRDNPYRVFSDILCIAPDAKAIHIFSSEAFENDDARTVWQNVVKDDRGMTYQGEFVLYDWIGESCSADLIDDKAVYGAIGCNEVYRAVFPENEGKPWNQLDETYSKYSNIFSFIFADKYKDLIIKKSAEGKTTADNDVLKKFAVLEHMRWCNYNYYFNWDFGETKNGKKDRTLRIHPDLADYCSLKPDEQLKDNNCVIWLQICDEMSGNVNQLEKEIRENKIIQDIVKQKNS